ncbi:ThiF family adenylyltransferase [Gelidibacter japonicus]|uniref:ThiF family adenylyltransferase n=1 Tax=Gelidibacter japonicus TaxID=1962232 RepID=UPI0013D48AFE|nr:ThiF family adenylyltransferase [Gelidibacter japonicus]
MERFSDSLPIFSDKIENPALQDSLNSLKILTKKSLSIHDWGNGRIGVPIVISVELPSLGNIDNIDIKAKEQIVLVFNLLNYPYEAPVVYTDRLDFPKDQLAHFYIAANNRPPAFCYVRCNRDEWYANKRIEDLIIRIANWLGDAAAGELNEDGEQFEPLRLEGYSGTIIYDYDTMVRPVLTNTPLLTYKNLSIALFERGLDINQKTYRFVKFLNPDNAIDTLKEVDIENQKKKDDSTRRKYHYGYLLWADEHTVNSQYSVNLPKNWADFKLFCAFFQIDYNHLENCLIANFHLNRFIHFPVIVAIRRTKPLIGYSSNIELINFRFWLKLEHIKDGKIIDDIEINFFSHNQPLTQKLAAKISNFQLENGFRTLVFGCGALGSKIIMHLARSGYPKLSLVDPDSLSPHNLVRHTLFAEHEGENKAESLARAINKMYPLESAPSFGFSDKEIINQKPLIEIHNWIMDFTASPAFFNTLSIGQHIVEKNVLSAMISDFGNLGILYREGNGRNPRIDDLQAHLYNLSLQKSEIKDWLKREKLAHSNTNLNVRVGIGCNSETTVLSDDKIASHASFFSGIIKKEMNNVPDNGKIFLSQISDDGVYSITTNTIKVAPVHIYQAINDNSWSVRIQSEVYEKIMKEFSKAKRNETGGVFVGYCNHKTKIIYVVDSIRAPKDSKANSIHFMRGIDGLPEEIENAIQSSGGQIGYIGEWHTHPKGPNALSDQDMESVGKHKLEFERLNPPLPVFLTIITPNGLFPFVY